MLRLIFLLCASSGLLLVGDAPRSTPSSAAPSCCIETAARAKCVGADPCRACKNCKYCAHCRGGKTCGVCKPKPK